MKWGLAITSRPQRQLRRMSVGERRQINRAFGEMCDDPFAGDVKFLKGLGGAIRKRVGDWRILFELNIENRLVVVTAIKRRGSHTY